METRTHNLRLPALVATIVVLALLAVSPNFEYSSGPQASPFGGDFLQEWVGAWILAKGEASQLYDLPYAIEVQHSPAKIGFRWDQNSYLPMVYPPFYYALIRPLATLPYVVATWLWASLMTGCLVSAAWLIGIWLKREVGEKRHLVQDLDRSESTSTMARWLPWLLPAAVLYAPVLESLASGQKGTLCLLIFTATFVLWDTRRVYLAGLVFGLMLFKPQLCLAMLAVAFWKRQWRLLAGVATTGIALALVSLSLGSDLCWQYLKFLSAAGSYSQNAGYDLAKSHSVFGFVELLLGWGPKWLVRGVGLIMAGGVVGLTVRLWTGEVSPGTRRFHRQMSATVLATLLLSPHLFTYDLTLLLLPMVLLIATHAEDRRVLPWLLALFALPVMSVSMAESLGFQPTVVVMAGLLWTLGRGHAPTEVTKKDFAQSSISLAQCSPN